VNFPRLKREAYLTRWRVVVTLAAPHNQTGQHIVDGEVQSTNTSTQGMLIRNIECIILI